MDEALPVFLSGLLLQAVVFGPIASALACVYFFSSKIFSDKYTEGGSRGDGYTPRMFAETTNFGLNVICAAKALFGPAIPY